MKITQHIKNANETLFSFEILPPKKGENIQKLFQNIDPLMEFKPPFIDVTYHREELVLKQTKSGLKKFSVRKRPGTVGICASLMNKYNVDAVPHVICGGFTKNQTEEALIDFDFLGIDNVLVLRGDPIKGESTFVSNKEGHSHATDLLKQINKLNKGVYLDSDQTDNAPTDFCMGVAGYPEKHFEAPNLEEDLKYLKQKVELGADYIVTQMFFDNQKYFDFVKLCRENGITVPIIPGIKPIAIQRHLTILPQFFHLNLPQELVDEVKKCKNNQEVRHVGEQWAIQQCKELMEFGVPVLHFYSMGKSDNIYNIAKELF
ncbi:methylenetetrahydrofolate reductase (NAD(P)H) [Flavobacteriaceae bacterium UJ101]|nr:methylenetetrahydrofolate reductase (NAD(P)H) [Flavobacteriaceae bacterium UJ101]